MHARALGDRMKRIDRRISGWLIRQNHNSVVLNTHLEFLVVLAKGAGIAPEMAAAVVAAVFGHIVLAAKLATGSAREDEAELWHNIATDVSAKHDGGSNTSQDTRGSKGSEAAARSVTGTAAGVRGETIRVEGVLDGTVNTARAKKGCTADAAVAAILAE